MTDIVRQTIEAEIVKLTRQSSTPVPPLGYGVDLKCVTDLDPYLAETNPETIESLAQDCFHRVTTARLSLVDDPSYGIDVRAALNKPQSPQQIQSWSGQIASELRRDDRVIDVVANLVFELPATYRITIQVTPANPALTPFSLIVAVTNGEALLEAINAALT
jgi:hypothetical protein